MAEERLIDDDKDRKYKIRINEDGEEELVIDESPDEDDDTPVFAMPEYEEDDEEAAILTPEQLAERERIKEEEEKNRLEKINSLIDDARNKLQTGEYEAALYAATQAEELDGENGEIHCLKLLALSHNLSDYTTVEECAQISEGVKQYASEESKAQLNALSSPLKRRIESVKAQVEKLRVENEEKKSERRTHFAQKRKRAVKTFSLAAIPFVVLLALAIAFSTVMFASEDGVFLIVTIVCAALAFIALIITLVTAHGLWKAQRNVNLNEKDTSTKLGREYLEKKGELDLLSKICSSFDSDYDIS